MRTTDMMKNIGILVYLVTFSAFSMADEDTHVVRY